MEDTNFDPAAEFLAREQEQLEGIDDSNLGIGLEENANIPAEGGLGDEEDFQFESADTGAEILQQNGPTSEDQGGYAAIAQIDKVRQEPEKIKKWREEQKERLEKKDAEDETKRAEWRDKAKKELEEWYSRQAEQLGKTKANNRAQEKVFIEERDADVPGEEWERIARLCDFNPKSSRHTKDVSRLRSIILQLKQTPVKTGAQ